MKKKVNKALSPEEQTALSNIQSILSELLTMSENGGGMEAPTEEPVEMAEGEDVMTPEEESSEGKEVKMIVKGLEETPSDAATASDDTEERMQEVQTEQTEENVNEVAKALLEALGRRNTVKKSAPLDPTTKALNQIVQVVKAQNDRQSVLEETLSHVLNGMGVMKQLEVAKSEQKKQPIVDNDNQAVLKAIQSMLTVNKPEVQTYESNSNIARKNLGSADVLKGLLGK